MNQMPQQESASMIERKTCRYCGKKYVRRSYINKHEQKEHGHLEDDQESTNTITKQDHIYNYTRQVLVLLLLRMNHNNAITLGDGGRVVRTYKFFYLLYKISGCPKYAYYMDSGILLGTKTLVELIRHYIRDTVRVFSVCHA